MIKLRKAYDARDVIKRVGGTWDGKEWSVTREQLAMLLEHAAKSARQFNKRDTEFARIWARVEVEYEDNDPSEGLPVDEKGRPV